MIRPSMTSVSEGQTLTLVCSVKQGTPPIRFSWYHNKKQDPLKSEDSNKLEEPYSIINVIREDEGKYYCVCTNRANETKQSGDVIVTGVLFYPQRIVLMMVEHVCIFVKIN